MITTKWLSRRIQTYLKYNLKIKIKDIKKKAQRNYNIGIKETNEISKRCATRDMVDGSSLEKYKEIYDYYHEIL